MTQLTLALALAWGLLPRGLADFAAATSHPAADKASPPLTRPAAGPAQSNGMLRLVVTQDTVIVLDGRRCRYAEVPRDVVITFAEVDSDGETALRVHYRSHQ
jgi:hypothetical protein